MKKVVISQPMVFPWVGLFEQILLADTFVHYDDVQLPQGASFIRRVQIKTPQGIHWLTIPVRKSEKPLIQDVILDNSQDWRANHLKVLHHSYHKAPFFEDMITLVETTYDISTDKLADLNIFAIEKIARYFEIECEYLKSSSFHTQSHSSTKLLEIVLQLGGQVYITGHGAKNYLDHSLFEDKAVRVEYMNYLCTPYTQLHGEFTPYVSILDLIANMGQEGAMYIHSPSIYWKDFIHERN